MAETAIGSQSIKVVVDGGSVYPLHAGAASRLLLAAQGPQAIHRYFQREVRRYTPRTIVEEKAFLAEAARVQERGYAYDPGEFTPEISAGGLSGGRGARADGGGGEPGVSHHLVP